MNARCSMSSLMTLATTLKADAGQLKADLSLAAGPSLEEMERSAAKIQAHYRGKRDRAIVEVKRVRAEFIARSKAERDLMFAMKTQSTLANLTDVKAMTQVSQHVRRVHRRLGGLNSCFTPATLRLGPVSLVCTGA